MNLQNKHIIIFILIVAAVLRFWNYFEIPFMHDEFSALFRTGFTNFFELIEKGVKTDTHPAGVQVFTNYWVLLFGDSPWVVKLPFTLMGLASIILTYKLGKTLFSETSGIISAALLSVTQYHIMYSQIARPYISGVFLCLLMAWFWVKLIQNREQSFWKYGIFMALAGAACAYNHHFSLLMAALIGFSGLFFLEKKFWLRYAAIGVLIFILYLPHINIFLGQLAQGGVGGKEGWLGAPDPSFFWTYFFYVFHFSKEFLVLFVVQILSLILLRKRNYPWKTSVVFSLWFLLPLVIAYFYSVYRNPVLQYSVLIFGFPFLILGLSGLVKRQIPFANAIICLLIMALGISTLISNRQHYKTFYESPYKEFLLEQNRVKKELPNYLRIIDSYPKTNDFYNQRLDIDTNYVEIQDFKNTNEFVQFLEHNKDNYSGVYFGQFERSNPLFVSCIDNYFGLDSIRHFAGGSSYWFENSQLEFSELYKDNFIVAQEDIASGELLFMNDVIPLEPLEYLLSQTFNLEDYPTKPNTVLDVTLRLNPLEDYSEVLIVSALHRKDSLIRWDATNIKDFKTDSTWVDARHCVRFPALENENETLKVYLWNREKIKLEVEYMNISYRESNPYLYGLYYPIKE